MSPFALHPAMPARLARYLIRDSALLPRPRVEFYDRIAYETRSRVEERLWMLTRAVVAEVYALNLPRDKSRGFRTGAVMPPPTRGSFRARP